MTAAFRRNVSRSLGRPLVLQEQHSIPGLANRVLARMADEVHLSFLEARGWFARRFFLCPSGSGRMI